jgi:hypothetical protein
VSDEEQERAILLLRREFADTLPTRLDAMRTALSRLRQGITPEGLKAFHLPAHALQGTAGSYEAHELVPHAARLSTLARRWIDAGAAPTPELEEAAQELEALEGAMKRFRGRLPY